MGGATILACPACGSSDVSVCMKAWLPASLEGGGRVLNADGLGSWCDGDDASCSACGWEGRADAMEREEAPEGTLTTYPPERRRRRRA